jgi:O-acetyl-ADP-ribose deacetylase (regulator of RNase III)
MLFLIVSVVSSSEECVALTKEETRIYIERPVCASIEMDRLLDPRTCWQTLDSIIRKIYLYPDLVARITPFDKLYEAIEYMPGGVRWFNVKVFEKYKEESPKLKEFFERFEIYWQSKQLVRLEKLEKFEKLEKLDKARNYAEMPLFPEEISRLENLESSWEEFDSIIKKIYPYLNVTSYEKLVKAMEATPGGIRWFNRDVFKKYKKENPKAKQFLKEFELYFRPKWVGIFEKERFELAEKARRAKEERQAEKVRGVAPTEILKQGKMRLVHENIIDLSDVDAIVNTTNEKLTSGGNLYDTILAAAGPSVKEKLEKLCYIHHTPTGAAFLTGGGDLKPKKIIHVVKPRYDSSNVAESERLLASAYKRSLEIARADGIRKIAFPCISTGACGYPLEVAAKVAMRTVGEFLQANDGYFDEITFCCFREDNVHIYLMAGCELELQNPICYPGRTREEKLNWLIEVISTHPKEQANAYYLEYVKEQLEKERAQMLYARTVELTLLTSPICCPGGTREEKLNWLIRVIPTRPKEHFSGSLDYLEYVKEQLKEERAQMLYARTLESELRNPKCCPEGTREEKLNWVISVIPTRPEEQADASADYLEYVKEQLKEERAQTSLAAVQFARTLKLDLQSPKCCQCCPGGTREEKLYWVISVIPTRPKEQANASADYFEYVKKQLKKERTQAYLDFFKAK